MSRIGDLIAVGLLGQPNALGLTANQAHEIGERVASGIALRDDQELRAAAQDMLDALSAYERAWLTSGTGYGPVRTAKNELRAALATPTPPEISDELAAYYRKQDKDRTE